ncbi:NAD(P)-dependent dehydrogenase (short-subunit alcohol dehydrogenase family) [Pseudomonas sp. YL-218 TE3947]
MTESVLVTGSSRGIGRAIALRLARAGHDIVLHCRSGLADAEAVKAEVEALGRNARILQFDVSDRASCKAILEADVETHGAYYGVVLNAGLTRDGAFPALSEEDWDLVMRTNLDGFYNVLHPVMMPMIRRRAAGRIVCITSVFRPDRQSRASQLQRVQGRFDRRSQGVGDRTGQTQNHGQLCRTRPDRHGDAR